MPSSPLTWMRQFQKYVSVCSLISCSETEPGLALAATQSEVSALLTKNEGSCETGF